MKTDREVLEGAIEILQAEDGWCQGTFVREDPHTQRLSYCAEGAIRAAIGYEVKVDCTFENPATGVVERTMSMHGSGADDYEQVIRVSQALSDHIKPARDLGSVFGGYSVYEFNDAKTTSKEDVILAMKEVMETL